MDSAGELQQSLDQREDVSDQMVEMMSGRLAYLQKLMVDRHAGLDGDVDAYSSFGSDQVPKMKPAFEEEAMDGHRKKKRHGHGHGHGHAGAGGGGGGLNTHPPPSAEQGLSVTLSRAALLERMSLPLDGDKLLSAKSKHVQNESQEKVESKRAQKSEIERELQANLESFVTRSVESVTYAVGRPPIGMAHAEKQPKLLLSHALQRIVMTNGERMFKHFSLNILARKVYCEAFWFVHCKHFQPGSEAEQAHLLEQLARTNVKLMAILKMHKDFFYKSFPYLVASAIAWGFHYVCPGSRHLYTSSFRSSVYQTVAEVLLGCQLCPISVVVTRKRLFPDEPVEEVEDEPTEEELEEREQLRVATLLDRTFLQGGGSTAASAEAAGGGGGGGGGGSGAGGEADEGAAAVGDEEGGLLAARATRAPLVKGSSSSSSSSSSSAAAAAADDEAPRPNPLARFIAQPDQFNAAEDVDKVAPRPVPRQIREDFEAAALSPMVQSYLRAPTLTGGRRGYNLLRTRPVEHCPIGGEDTFRPKPSREALHASMAKQNRKDRKQYLSAKYSSLRELQTQLAEIDKRKHRVLRGGMSDVGRFCLGLVQRAESRRRGEDVAEPEF